jgi:putative aldouronate transport system substrate-binding protein
MLILGKHSVTVTTRFMAFTLAIALLAGCSNSGESAGTNKEGGEADLATTNGVPKKLTMYLELLTAEPPKPDNVVLMKVKEHTGTQLDITWIPTATYNEKFNASIASGELPMALRVSDNKAPTIINSVRSGSFWEIGPYLKDYPNLEKYMNKDVMESIKIDGKIYGLFRTRPLVGDGPIYREDWMKQLGLTQPKTIEELYNLIKAYTLNDPDKNGKNDTIGLFEVSSLRGLNYLLAVHGAPNAWGLKDEKLSPSLLSSEYLDALKFYRRLYTEKLMNQDFAVNNRNQQNDMINGNKVGMYLGDPDQVGRFADLLKIAPNAEMNTFVKLEGVKGTRIFLDRGYNSLFYFPKASIKTEADLKQVLKFFNMLSDEKMQNLLNWGIEGVHYSVKDGKAMRDNEQAKKYPTDMDNWRQGIQIVNPQLAMPGIDDPFTAKWKKAKQEMEDKLVRDPASSIISKTFLERGGELSKITSDAQIKFIMGEIDEAGWGKALEQWKSAGGNQIITEYNEEYTRLKK